MTIQKTGAITGTVENASDETAKGVRITLMCPSELEVFDPTFEPLMPSVPDAQAENYLTRLPSLHASHLDHQARSFVGDRDLTISRSSSSLVIKKLGKLHPHETVTVNLPPLFYCEIDGHDSFEFNWSVTASNRKGRAAGRINAAISQRSATLRDLLPPRPQHRS